MEILKVKNTIGGRYRYIVKLVNDEIVSFFSNTVLDTATLEERETDYIEKYKYDDEPQAEINVLENEQLIRAFITEIKNNPTVTFTQYNNWLDNREWYESTIIKYFVYSLALKIAERLGVDVTSYTESQVFIYLRNWLVTSEIKKIEKVVFNLM